MKSISIYAFIVAFACSPLLISSANAGGHHAGVGLSSSATTSTSATSTGRSPLGEPVFLIPSTTGVSGSSGGPIGGYVPPRAPLPPLRAPDPSVAALVGPTSTSTGATVVGRERVSPAREQMRLDRGTKIIFTPPPTIVGVPPSVTGTGNIAGNNLADRTFGTSILNSGLESKKLHSSFNVQTGANGQPTPQPLPLPLQYSGPTASPPPTGH